MDLNGVFGSFLTRLCAASVCLYSYGRTSFCSPRQWRASTLTSRKPCRPHSSSNNRFSRSNKSSRWPSQLSPSKSSCRPSNSKVSQQWHTVVKTFLNKCKNPWTPFWALEMSPAALSYLPKWHRKQWMLTDRVHSLYILWKIWGIDLKMFVSAAPQQQVIVQESKLIHMGGTGMVSGS